MKKAIRITENEEEKTGIATRIESIKRKNQ